MINETITDLILDDPDLYEIWDLESSHIEHAIQELESINSENAQSYIAELKNELIRRGDHE